MEVNTVHERGIVHEKGVSRRLGGATVSASL